MHENNREMMSLIMPLDKEDISLDKRARGEWCLLPYPNHPKGCPNYGKKQICPPFSKPFNEIVEPPFHIVIENFDLEAQAKKMKKRHPEWSDRQCRNLLYWQKGVVKKLKGEAREFIKSQKDDLVLLEVPEANGVHVFDTCKNVGVVLEREPKIVRKIMIIGKRK